MKVKWMRETAVAVLAASMGILLVGCGESKPNPSAEAPPPATVEEELNVNNFKVDHPEKFPLTKAVEYKAPSTLDVTGVVNPDIARAVPVISLAAGRVVDIKARLGDEVKKGQVLLRVRRMMFLGYIKFT